MTMTSNAFNFNEYIISGVDVRIGSFSLEFSLGKLLSNNLSGPTFEKSDLAFLMMPTDKWPNLLIHYNLDQNRLQRIVVTNRSFSQRTLIEVTSLRIHCIWVGACKVRFI